MHRGMDDLLTSEFDFALPEEAIAQHPLPRGEARLLVLDTSPGDEGVRHRRVRDLQELLRPGDLVVVNDTRVIPARLYGLGLGGGRIELLLVERPEPLDERTWTALVKPARKARVGSRVEFAARTRWNLRRGAGPRGRPAHDSFR